MPDVSIMALPSAPSLSAHGPDGAILLLGVGGTWKGRPLLAPGPSQGLNALRTGMERTVTKVMRIVDGPGGAEKNVYPHLMAHFQTAYRAIIPADINAALAEALADRAAGGTPPLLRIHVHPELEWIPWELLHDGTDHLGVRFRIARLPIVDSGPEARPPDSPRVVTKIASVLGETIVDGQPTLLQDWRDTFDGLANGVVPMLHPAADVWPVIDDVLDAVGADIVHITCHAGFTAKDGTGYWSLNEKVGNEIEHHINLDSVNVMKLSHGPLVFANACSSVGPNAPAAAAESGMAMPSGGLATAFFRKETLAFIGTLAPITRQTAIPFARTFFTKLLGDKLPVAEALWATKVHYKGAEGTDPSWLFYCLYGPPDTTFTY